MTSITASPMIMTFRAPARSPTTPPTNSSAARGKVIADSTRPAADPPLAEAAHPKPKYSAESLS